MVTQKSATQENNRQKPTRTQFARMVAKQLYDNCFDPRMITVDAFHFTVCIANGSPIKLNRIYEKYMAANRNERFSIIERFACDCVQSKVLDDDSGSEGSVAATATSDERTSHSRTYNYKISIRGKNRVEIVSIGDSALDGCRT